LNWHWRSPAATCHPYPLKAKPKNNPEIYTHFLPGINSSKTKLPAAEAIIDTDGTPTEQ
jgi:hypothetical protein